MNKQDEIVKLFPDYMKRKIQCATYTQDAIQEIRLAVGRPARVITGLGEFFPDEDGKLGETMKQAWCPTEKEIEDIIKNICRYSLYAYENEIRQGFLTVQGGHRIGVAGQVITDAQGQVRNISNIRFINIRIAHEVIGVADQVMPFLYQNGYLYNCLIVSPPGCGKTTMLRDIVRQVSDGNRYGKGRQVGIVDERSEIAGSYLGIPQNNVGIRTDVLDACPKVLGMMLLMRSMSPAVVAVDEIGSDEDMRAIATIAKCGSNILATMHAGTEAEVSMHLRINRERMKATDLLFKRYLFMKKENGIPRVEKILDADFKKIG